jgi:hypothetical protein
MNEKGVDVNSNDEMEFKNVVHTLKQLQQVKAPAGFEADLMRKINSENFSDEKKFWQNIFVPSRLIPSAVLVLTAFFLIFVLNNQGVTQDNPLLTAPRERQDVATLSATTQSGRIQKGSIANKQNFLKDAGGLAKNDEMTNKPAQKMMEESRPETIGNDKDLAATKTNSDQFISVKFASGNVMNYPVNKAGLNFRQINLTTAQKMKLNLLKEKLENFFRLKGKL